MLQKMTKTFLITLTLIQVNVVYSMERIYREYSCEDSQPEENPCIVTLLQRDCDAIAAIHFLKDRVLLQLQDETFIDGNSCFNEIPNIHPALLKKYLHNASVKVINLSDGSHKIKICPLLLGGGKTMGLHTAVIAKDHKKVQECIKKKILKDKEYSIDSLNEANESSLMLACGANGGDLDIIKILVENDANIHLHNGTTGNTALLLACQYGYVDIADYLLSKIKRTDLEEVNNSGETALALACQHKKMAVIRLLITNGANPRKIKPSLWSTLDEDVKYLMQMEEPAYTSPASPTSASTTKAEKKQTTESKVNKDDDQTKQQAKTQKSAEPNDKSSKQSTRQSTPSAPGNTASGAAQSKQSESASATPQPVALQKFHDAIRAKDMTRVEAIYREHEQTNKRFIIDTPDEHLNTALHIACSESGGSREIVGFLIKKGADLKKKNQSGTTPFMLCCINNHIECVTFLLLHDGRLVDDFNNNKLTALAIVSKDGNIAMIKLLLQNGATKGSIPSSTFEKLPPNIKSLLNQQSTTL